MERHPQQKFIKDSHELRYSSNAPSHELEEIEDDELPLLNWIISAFNLCNAAFIPFWGQIADVFGRYTAIQSALITAFVGTTLCASAPNTAFPMLLIGRALQGAGCAGLLIVTKIILADKVSLEENAKNNTIFTFVGGVGFGLGPVIGGYLTQANWRYCFIITIPISVKVRRIDGNETVEIPQSFAAKVSTIDFGGQVLFILALGLLILALTWGGSYYPWANVRVLTPLIASGHLILAFLLWEYLLLPSHLLSIRLPTQRSMVPLPLLASRNMGVLIISLTTGMAQCAILYFSSFYFILIESFTAGEAGRNLIYYTPGLGVALGALLEPLGITLLGVAMSNGNLPWVYGMLALAGAGSGVGFMPATLHGVGYHPRSISSIVSLMALCNNIGGALSTTLMLSIFNNHMSSFNLSFSSSSAISSIFAASSIPDSEHAYFKLKAKEGMIRAFFAQSAFLWLALLAMTWMGNVKIGKREDADQVTAGSFVGSWFVKRTR
ncbi:hypothetical protein IFR04_002472 [Cadophora malorum]|uniref:Major facilitator superfamily (MFS) profile domain-containing protein n=1 Tax=Cadophora malorum TaxID=108018 RepID=A0A8H8BUF5_9HELO|nr:hypothetical protein IFR04_002472 [Cadophora malorum]